MAKSKASARGDELLLTGAGVGVIGVAGAVLLGATCPVCVVATPVLVGAGLWQKYQARRRPPSGVDDPTKVEP
ncbi:MAG: hypothetical protein IPI67_04170 [Myxococcales bacterium]|nr:hypothetical protein [Myxococcales bacterium]